MATKTRIFLSYQRSSGQKIAKYIHRKLTELGADVWFDQETLGAGDFHENIDKAIHDSDHFLVLQPELPKKYKPV